MRKLKEIRWVTNIKNIEERKPQQRNRLKLWKSQR